MATNQRYYYLKLKENFFSSETMVILESMPDGLMFSNLLLKMYLMSLKDEGQLLLNNHLPHTPQTIATITRHQVGTVERGIAIFLKLGLVEQLNNSVYYMTNIQMFIGQSSTEGERKKRERLKLEQSRLLPASADICPAPPVDNCPPILERELELEKDIEKEKERELEKDRRDTQNTPPPYGRYHNVRLTEQEYEELQSEYPDQWERYIERLSEYMASSGKKYVSHVATIRHWITEDRKKKPRNAIPTYTCKEGESL